jgi:hypothetical protein
MCRASSLITAPRPSPSPRLSPHAPGPRVTRSSRPLSPLHVVPNDAGPAAPTILPPRSGPGPALGRSMASGLRTAPKVAATHGAALPDSHHFSPPWREKGPPMSPDQDPTLTLFTLHGLAVSLRDRADTHTERAEALLLGVERAFTQQMRGEPSTWVSSSPSLSRLRRVRHQPPPRREASCAAPGHGQRGRDCSSRLPKLVAPSGCSRRCPRSPTRRRLCAVRSPGRGSSPWREISPRPWGSSPWRRASAR